MIIENYSWEEGLAGIIKGEGCEVRVRDCQGKLWEKTVQTSAAKKRGRHRVRAWPRKGMAQLVGCGVKRRRVGKSFADSSSQMVPTGLKLRGGEKRQNSVSRVTAPTVPAAQVCTTVHSAGGREREGRRA